MFRTHRKFSLHLACLIGLVISGPAEAYIGPGAGLSAIGTVIAVIGAFLLLILGFVWYPVKRMLRRRKAGDPEPPTSDDVSGP